MDMNCQAQWAYNLCVNHERGDTLIEVLIATVVLSAAVVGGLGIMNFGFGAILNSIERTQVQAGVNSQLSLIQYTRDAYARAGRDGTAPGAPSVWQKILNKATSAYSTDVCAAAGAGDTSRNPFYVKDDGTLYQDAVPAIATATPTAGTGLWVEAVRPTPTTNYIDVYVKSCWEPAAGATNQESRSAMRLYVP